ncbi:MAG: nicotinate phosphoribosyltransferase [Candidatus Nanohaloarchaea archaeon]|nr:nicotinate phosphoribosyltransferase [Candidatus Nanohaloarchaea archaeon]
MDDEHDELVERFRDELPDDHRPYTDKYFMRSRQILEADETNPDVAVKVFARGEGEIPDEALAEAQAIVEEYAEPAFSDNGGELYLTEEDEFGSKDPLMVLKGKAQDVVELETMYLGAMSHHLSEANGVDTPTYEDMREEAAKVAELYDEADVPFLYFGARHYHWSKDDELAAGVLDAGAVQTSTDVGSSNIDAEGVGTTPHFLTLTLAGSEDYSPANATRRTAELFDEHMDDDIPRTTLIDTFNREIDDALDVARYFDEERDGDDWTAKFRVDTCGENHAQGMDPADVDPADDYRTGTGVRIEPVKALRDRLIEEGYGDNTEIILSSGFGDPDKAEAFVDAQHEYREESQEKFGESYDLFHGVGAGSFDDGIHCTADIYAVDGEPMAKTGREQDIEAMETYIDEHMEQVI